MILKQMFFLLGISLGGTRQFLLPVLMTSTASQSLTTLNTSLTTVSPPPWTLTGTSLIYRWDHTHSWYSVLKKEKQDAHVIYLCIFGILWYFIFNTKTTVNRAVLMIHMMKTTVAIMKNHIQHLFFKDWCIECECYKKGYTYVLTIMPGRKNHHMCAFRDPIWLSVKSNQPAHTRRWTG